MIKTGVSKKIDDIRYMPRCVPIWLEFAKKSISASKIDFVNFCCMWSLFIRNRWEVKYLSIFQF